MTLAPQTLPPTGQPTPVARRGPVRRFLNRLEVDQATFYALCLRVWQFLAGPVSIFMIATYFSPDVQGYFYTFAYLMGLQSFFELGMNIVVINLSSHQWSHLRLDENGRIDGDPAARSQLVGFGRWLAAWYSIAAVLFAVGVGCLGGWFLGRKDVGAIDWVTPWIALVLLSAVMLWQLPQIVMLEGCGQIKVVNRFRLYQAISGSLAVWTCIALGGGLWSAVAAAAVQVSWNMILVFIRFRRFFAAFYRPPEEKTRIDWRTDIWPMQWRLALSGVLIYFAFAFVPVMFDYHGAAVAGRMGMTWQLATVLQAVALAWVQTRVPLFGQLVAKQDYRELDRVFFRLTQVSFAVVVAGASAIGLAVWFLYWQQFGIARRFLEPIPCALLLLGITLYHIPNCQAFYIRAHKRDPLFLLNVVSSSTLAFSIWWFGSQYGPVGSAAAYVCVVAMVVLPGQTFIWWQCRKTHK